MEQTEADIRVQACIDRGTSFLLDAGAGSGKTTTLIRALTHIRGKQRDQLMANSQRVACITFTNVAKDEITERTERDPLFMVSTIHDFLWGAIKSFQQELKSAVSRLNDELPQKSRKKKDPAELSAAMATLDLISYSDRGGNFLEGRIFHDDLLDVAHILFREHPMLSRLVAARYPFIFVDEYQDTNQKVISILLDYLVNSKVPPVIGFFGDKMQSIYPDGVGELSEAYKSRLSLIKKEENYRCAISVINVLNKIRSDIQQRPAGKNAVGSAVYINLHTSNAVDTVEKARELISASFNWSPSDSDLKILFLTHRLIARRAGYGTLWGAYNKRGGFVQDQFQSGTDEIGRFLCQQVDTLIRHWVSGNIGGAISTLNAGGAKLVASKREKSRISSALESLVGLADKGTIKDVVKLVQQNKLLELPDRLADTLSAGDVSQRNSDEEPDLDKVFVEEVLAVPYKEVRAYHDVLEENLPYSTKHGVKGDEFQNVLVVLDDAGANWSQYSFSNLLADADTSEDRLRRTRNLFYVSCSRAKERLAVVDLAPPKNAERIRGLFGPDKCIFA